MSVFTCGVHWFRLDSPVTVSYRDTPTGDTHLCTQSGRSFIYLRWCYRSCLNQCDEGPVVLAVFWWAVSVLMFAVSLHVFSLPHLIKTKLNGTIKPIRQREQLNKQKQNFLVLFLEFCYQLRLLKTTSHEHWAAELCLIVGLKVVWPAAADVTQLWFMIITFVILVMVVK